MRNNLEFYATIFEHGQNVFVESDNMDLRINESGLCVDVNVTPGGWVEKFLTAHTSSKNVREVYERTVKCCRRMRDVN